MVAGVPSGVRSKFLCEAGVVTRERGFLKIYKRRGFGRSSSTRARVGIPWKGIQTKRKGKNDEKWAQEKGEAKNALFPFPLQSHEIEGSDPGMESY